MTARVLPFTKPGRIVLDRVRDPVLGRLEYRASIGRGEKVSNVWAGESLSDAHCVIADIEKAERAQGRRCVVVDRTGRVGDAHP